MVDLLELRDEIQNDPETLGLGFAITPPAGESIDEANARLLNEIGVGRTIQRTRVQASEILEAIDYPTDFAALLQPARDYLDLLLEFTQGRNAGELDVSAGTNFRAALLDIFGAGTATRANLLAMVQRDGSRAEELWGERVRVTARNVGDAENLVGR